jgi:hypothetical protein
VVRASMVAYVQVSAAYVIFAIPRVTAVCARTLPTREEPVMKSSFVLAKRMPCIDASVPI